MPTAASAFLCPLADARSGHPVPGHAGATPACPRVWCDAPWSSGTTPCIG
ncbi:hypothetical protein RGUI_4360 (plasmid) [Rhodovulum sp. P5]|nr:hypothetical protein RGUI_4242 [Rhodovulum sp. P5]ARE42386.1 hypothetical protein RGUI_4360 [Rhodovulum sp. P5]